jgi:hypothetical protein
VGGVADGMVLIRAEIVTNAAEICVTVDGVKILGEQTPTGYVIEKFVPEVDHHKLHSEWRDAYGRMIIVIARTEDTIVADYTVVCGVA